MKLVLKAEYKIRQSGEDGRAIGIPPLWQMDLKPGTSLQIYEDAETGDLLVKNPNRLVTPDSE